MISKALDLLKDRGSLSLSQLPYEPLNCSPISPAQISEANDFRISSWNVVNRDTGDRFMDNVKGSLQQGKPVIISMRASDAFDRVRAGDVYRSPSTCKQGEDNCYHAMVVVGYNERMQAFKLMNSWGTRWGDRGFGWVGYEAFRSEVREGYVMSVVEEKPPTCSLSAEPPSIEQGGSVLLKFTAQNADSGVIDGVGNLFGSNGSRMVWPSGSTVYQAKFIGRGGVARCSVRVDVRSPPPPPPKPIIESFNARPTTIKRGEKAAGRRNDHGGRYLVSLRCGPPCWVRLIAL